MDTENVSESATPRSSETDSDSATPRSSESDSEAGIPVTPRPSRFLSLGVLGTSIFLAGCTLSILAPFYSKEAEDHGMSVTSSGVVFASAFVLQIVSTPIFGKYLHQIGSERLFMFGCVTSGLTNIMFGFLPNIESGRVFLGLSLLVRSLTALGESAMSTAVYPLAMRCDQSSQSTALAAMETMFGAGTTIGPFIGGLLFKCGGFLLPFLTCGGLLILCALAAFLVLPRGGTMELPDCETGSDVTEVAVDDEEVEVVTLNELTYSSLLRSPLMVAAASVTFLTGVSTQWYQPSLEPYVRNQFGLSAFQASLLFIIDGGVYSVVAPLTGRLLDRGLECLPVLALGSLTISLGYLLLAPLPPGISPSLELVVGGAAVHGLGMALNFIATISLMTQVARSTRGSRDDRDGRDSTDGDTGKDSEQVHGLATGLWITCESLGGVIGSTAGGASYDWLGWRNSCLLVSALQAVSVVVVVGVWLLNITRTKKKNLERNKLLARNKQTYGTMNNNRYQG